MSCSQLSVAIWISVALFGLAPNGAAHGGSGPYLPPGGPAPGNPRGPHKNPGKHHRPGTPTTPGPGSPTPPDSPTTPPDAPSTPPDAPTTPSDPGAPTTPGSSGPASPGTPPSGPTRPSTAPTGSGSPAGAPLNPIGPAKPGSGPGTGPATPGSTGPAGAPTGGGVAARTGGSGIARRAISGNDRWEAWWSCTRELYLGRHGSDSATPQTQAGNFTSGRVLGLDDGSLLPDSVRRDLLPLLADALRDPASEVADSAAIAIGRSVGSRDAAMFLPLLQRNLSHSERTPQQAAVVGLGILGGVGTGELLLPIALDLPAGRQSCGTSGPIDEMLRGLALLALGLTASSDATAPLAKLASGDASNELKSAAILALGLQKSGAPTAAAALAKLLDERALDRGVRAQIPIAISRLPAATARGLLPKLCELLRDKKTANESARSLALALGRIATPDDIETLDALRETARRHDDAATRQFSLIAIGRVYERNSAASGDARKLRSELLTFLIEQLRRSESRAQRPFAALAAALLNRGDPTFGTAAPSTEISATARALIDALEQESDPSTEGALAIALGLLDAPSGAAVLRARLDSTANPTVRGHLATALGLMHDATSSPQLERLLADPALAPATRVDVARALALTGSPDLEKRLLTLFAEADDLPSSTAYAKALGLVGGQYAAAALKKIVADRDRPEIQRGFAVIAIGLLAERTAVPWNVPYLVDANTTLPLRPLEEVLDLL